MRRLVPGACLAAMLLAVACSGNGPAAPTPTVTPLPESTATAVTAAVATTAPTVAATAEATAEPTAAPPQTAAAVAPGAPQAPLPSPTPEPEPTTRPAPIRIDVLLKTADRFFDPHQIHGNIGDLVVVTIDNGSERHNFSIDALGINEDVPANATKVVQFRVANEEITPFYCRIHGSPTSGMRGLLIFH